MVFNSRTLKLDLRINPANCFKSQIQPLSWFFNVMFRGTPHKLIFRGSNPNLEPIGRKRKKCTQDKGIFENKNRT